MRLTYTVAPQLSEDAAGTNTLFGPLAGESGVIVDSMQNETSGRISLKPGTTQTINMGTLTFALGCYLRVNSDCTISINNGTPLRLFRASQGLNVKARFFFEGIITSIHVTAPPDSNAYGIYAVWGDSIEDGARTDNLPPVIGAPGTALPVAAQVIAGDAPPTSLQGRDGDSFIDRDALVIYGPKVNGVWPMPGTSLRTETNPDMDLYEGYGFPAIEDYPQAKAGSLYLDKDSGTLFELTPQTFGS